MHLKNLSAPSVATATMPPNLLPHLLIGSQCLTIIWHLTLHQCCERPRWSWSYIASFRTLSLTSRTIQHKACSQVGVLFVCLFGRGFSWGVFLLVWFVVVFLVFGFFFLHRWDQTQYQSVSDSLMTLRLLTFSLFRIEQNTYLDNSCTHRTFLPSIPCIPSGPRAWTCYCLVEKSRELA